MTVLLVSADLEFRALVAFLLTYHGLAVDQADLPVPSGGDATPPTLALLDLTSMAPSTAAAFLATPAVLSLPVIVLSWPDQLAEARAHLPQAVAALPVPVVPRELVALVRRWIAPAADDAIPHRLPASPT